VQGVWRQDAGIICGKADNESDAANSDVEKPDRKVAVRFSVGNVIVHVSIVPAASAGIC
jgi:hypothetical protein